MMLSSATEYLNWQAYKTISDATVTPALTGEDIFGLQGGFQPLLDNRALDAIHSWATLKLCGAFSSPDFRNRPSWIPMISTSFLPRDVSGATKCADASDDLANR